MADSIYSRKSYADKTWQHKCLSQIFTVSKKCIVICAKGNKNVSRQKAVVHNMENYENVYAIKYIEQGC